MNEGAIKKYGLDDKVEFATTFHLVADGLKLFGTEEEVLNDKAALSKQGLTKNAVLRKNGVSTKAA